MKKIENMDELLPVAVKILIEENNGKASTTIIQRMLNISYPRAARIVDQMEVLGFISEAKGAHGRDVLVTKEQFQKFLKDSKIEDIL